MKNITFLDASGLADLRNDLHTYMESIAFSDVFREACREAIASIDATLADESMQVETQRILRHLFGDLAEAEAARIDTLNGLLSGLDEAEDSEHWRFLMLAALPLLTSGHLLGLRSLMMDAAADFQPFNMEGGICFQ
jgi:hypothetical protein